MTRVFSKIIVIMALMFLSNCQIREGEIKTEVLTAQGGPVIPELAPDVPMILPAQMFDTIFFAIQSRPGQPQNERFLGDWRYQIYNIDDQARPKGPSYFGEMGIDATTAATLPIEMFMMPLVIRVYNEVAPTHKKKLSSFEIFVPPNCFNQALWLISPDQSAIWDYYFQAAIHRGNAWRPSQVHCPTWLKSLEALGNIQQVREEIGEGVFRPEVLINAWQENQELLVATRPPICLSARRHVGGSMASGNFIAPNFFPVDIDDIAPAYYIPGPPIDLGTNPDFDPLVINAGGMVESICGIKLFSEEPSFLLVNGNKFNPSSQYFLSSLDFNGSIHTERAIVPNIDISFFNIRLGNGRTLNDYFYDDACSLSQVMQVTNTKSEDLEILSTSGVTLSDLFGAGKNNEVIVWKTSDGDDIVDEHDSWVIFHAATSSRGEPVLPGQERVIAVELQGIRQGDYKDSLYMTQTDPESLFVGLKSNYLLGDQTIEGQKAFLSYTITTWSGEDYRSRQEVRTNIASCYEASDVWARSFFVTRAFQEFERDFYDHCFDNCSDVNRVITPLMAAEMAVRSQCFSNSRSNNKWQNSDFGYWSMNANFGAGSNVIINPGWLGPDLDFELYVQSFDEAVFKGPRVLARSDYVGQLLAVIPTLVEGDRVLIRALSNCCSDYDLIIPCVPEFTEFLGWPGLPYVGGGVLAPGQNPGDF